jgi:hypothetical protein
MIVPLLSDPLSFLSFVFLALSILAIWLTPLQKRTWQVLALLSAVFAFISGRISFQGLIIEIGFGTITYLFYRKSHKNWQKVTCALSILVIGVILSLHKFPEFQNWLILSNLKLSPDAFPTKLYLNLDKPLVGLFILAWSQPILSTRKDWILTLKQTIPLVFLSSPVLLFLSYILNYVRFNFKWFEFSGTWLIFNLLFTCVAEEAFFRRFLQSQLTCLLGFWKNTQNQSPRIAWIFTSVLFGLAHFPGGKTYVLLSTIAGLFYGYAYLSTRRIEASIITHFSVNAIHFIFFTYPAIQR